MITSGFRMWMDEKWTPVDDDYVGQLACHVRTWPST
jgi:hypothetical protein